MVSLLHAYCQSEGLPAATSLYLSAIAHDNVTISGPPQHLDRFRASNNHLHTTPVLIRGLFHAPHLYTLNEAKELARDSTSLFHRRPVRLSVLSNADGRVIPDSAATAADLLSVAVGEILTRPMQWSQMTKRAVDMLASYDETIVLPFGAGSSAHAFGKAPGFRIRETITGERGRKTPPLEQSTRSKIAIIGFSGRYPEAENNEEFWELLLAGRDVHREIPRDRFDPWLYYDETGKRKNTSGVRHGCFLKNPALFDAKFFGLSPREAEQADPAQRLALMTAYEAMEMAGLVPDASPSTQRDRIGVFYGTASDDYRECNSGQDIDTYFVPGGSRAFLPARINYQWRFSGPSLDVDTACSSSLAALHMACNCLWRGDCDTALAGGTNVLTNPDNWAGLDRAHFLSRTGNCRTFDDGADGYCRSESVSTLVLKRLDDALRDGDPVFGTILGAYTNHSAEAVSMTRPHSGAQRAIFGRVLAGAGVDREDVSYIEMHGTGTQAGDACEMDAVLSVFAPSGSPRSSPLYLGSAKANIGHAESASGVASLIKVLLMMNHELIPPHVGIKTRINRNFPSDLAKHNVHIARQGTPWPRPSLLDEPHGRRAFVNNFGAAGGNSSVLLEDAPLPRGEEPADPRPVHVVAVSARTTTALQRNIRALREHLDTAIDISLSSLSYTTTARRMHHSFRVMVAGSSLMEIRDGLRAIEDGTDTLLNSATAPPISFCFTGQGCQYLGMGREMLKMPPFRAIMMRLEGLVQLHGFPSIMSVLDGSSNTAWEDLAPVQTQLAQTCLQIALAKYWLTLGLLPQLVVGHSLGEYAAMNASGMLSDAETVYLVGTRAMLLQEHCTAGTHTMLAIKASQEQVTAALTGSSFSAHNNLEIACVNGPQDTVVAGPTSEIDDLTQWFGKQSIKTTRVQVPFAFHSAQVEPMLAAFRQSCRAVVFHEPKIPILSPLLGRTIRSLSDLGAADPATYLSRHCREAVGFSAVLQKVEAKNVWIEVGPHPICANMLRNSMGTSVRVLPTLSRNENDWKTVVSALATLYESGLPINWAEYHRGFGGGWRKYWIPYRHNWCLSKGDPPATAPALIQETAVQRIVEESHDVKYPTLMAVLRGHRINGRPLCPSSVYADMALTLFTRLLDKSPLPGPSMMGVSVTDMVVDKALLLDEVAPAQWIELKATACCIPSDPCDGRRATEQHAKCTGSFTPKTQWKAEWKRRGFLVASRMQQLQRALHDGGGDDSDSNGEVQLLRPGLFYKLFGSIVEYDAAFRGLRELIMHPVGLECTARVRFNTAPGEADHWGGCSPYWIESLGQITGFSLNGNDALDNESQVFINHGWGCMRLLTPLSPLNTYRTYVKMHKDENSYLGDLYIFDSDGEIIGMYEGVVFNSLRRDIFDRVLPKPQPQAVQSTRIRALVADEVGVPATELTDNDDLAELGVDSLLALTMTDRIRAEFGVTVPSTVFMDPLTVRGLIQLISGGPTAELGEETDSSVSSSGTASDTPESSQSSLAEWSLEPSPKLPPIPSASSVLLQGDPRSATKTLWLVPDGSGLATSYLALPDIEPSNLAVRSGLQDLCMSQRSFSQLTEAYTTEIRRRQPHGPYYLGGWSAGGIWETVLRLILIDSPNPIGLAKLPARVYDELTRLGVFGSDAAAGQGHSLPSWLLPHFVGFPFKAPGPLQTWAIWAQDGVDNHESVVIQPEDPPNLHWLLRKRTGAALGTNGWEVLVGKENIHVEVLQEANHFTMLKEPAARRVSSLLAKAVA
ncbi:hypothetical protein BDW72DRAFT_211629 [Aspergillus terricola var. indicus]